MVAREEVGFDCGGLGYDLASGAEKARRRIGQSVTSFDRLKTNGAGARYKAYKSGVLVRRSKSPTPSVRAELVEARLDPPHPLPPKFGCGFLPLPSMKRVRAASSIT